MSYRKIGLTTMAVTQDHHSGMPLVLIVNKNSSALGTVYYLNLDNPVPSYPNSYAPLHARSMASNAFLRSTKTPKVYDFWSIDELINSAGFIIASAIFIPA